jgi:hypothetical protein
MRQVEIPSGVISPIPCLREGWELIKSDFWLLFAIWLVGGLIGSVSMLIAAGAMTCGTFYCYLKKIDGEPVSFDDLWKGLRWFVPGLIVMLIIVVPVIAIYVIAYVPILLAATMGARMSQEEVLSMLLGAFAVDAVLLVGMVCLHSLLIFSFPLIVDRNIGAFGAMAISARAVVKNIGGVVGLMAADFLLILLGYLALCVGVYFTIPIILAGNVVAYRKIFPRQEFSATGGI